MLVVRFGADDVLAQFPVAAATLAELCGQMQAMVHAAGLDDVVRGPVQAAYHALGDDVPVAVRSSAIGEDSAGASSIRTTRCSCRARGLGGRVACSVTAAKPARRVCAPIAVTVASP